MTEAKAAWNALRDTPATSLTELFTNEPDRLSRLSMEEAGILFDFSKTHLSAALIDRFAALAGASGQRHREPRRRTSRRTRPGRARQRRPRARLPRPDARDDRRDRG